MVAIKLSELKQGDFFTLNQSSIQEKVKYTFEENMTEAQRSITA